jgi:hypothetical protein
MGRRPACNNCFFVHSNVSSQEWLTVKKGEIFISTSDVSILQNLCASLKSHVAYLRIGRIAYKNLPSSAKETREGI